MELITAKVTDNVLFLMPHDRVDTNNASEAETLIKSLCEQNPLEDVVLDVEDLEYISSAGLRVVLRLRKDKPTLRIINASPEIFDIFEMTGFSEMIPVEKAFRKMSVDGCTVIGRGAKGTVYRYNGDTIIKVYHDPNSLPDIRRERELAKKAFVLGVPTSISFDVVRVGDSYGSVFEMLEAKSYSEMLRQDPDNFDKYAEGFAKVLRDIHATSVKPDDMPNGKIDSVDKWLSGVKGYIPEEEYAKLKRMADEIPDQLTMMHGDYHTNNVMYQNGETMLIDMDTLSYGHPILELANVFAAYGGLSIANRENCEHFIGLSYEKCQEFWYKFLGYYLQTDDKARIDDVDRKAQLLCYCRVLRHSLKREADTEMGQKTIAMSKEKISELLKTTDTLLF